MLVVIVTVEPKVVIVLVVASAIVTAFFGL